MSYAWDDNKLTINLEKHRVPFSLVEQFDWETAMIEADNRKQYGEDRFCAFGLIGTQQKAPTKVSTTVRFDADVLAAFKSTGSGWQTRMNDALKGWLRDHAANVN